ncbi:hypothetical protein SJDPG4_01130 [Porphyromonas gingivalis SJD4]|nr:hypothetical protein SJDPG4_01130 [Porphyromonas gingivalis SJD4]
MTTEKSIRRKNVAGIISQPIGLRAGIFVFAVWKNVARKLFRFGARSKKISNQNEKNPAPPSSEKTRHNQRIFGSYRWDSG